MYEIHITPKSEAELSNLMPDGRYRFQIIKPTAGEKNGLPQMIWSLKLWGNDGREYRYMQFFKIDESSPFCMRILRHALYSVGRGDLWERGKWNASDFENLMGDCLMGTQKAGYGKDGKTWYEAKNVIKDFIVEDKALKAAVNSLPSKQISNDLPPVEAYDDIPQ